MKDLIAMKKTVARDTEVSKGRQIDVDNERKEVWDQGPI